MSLTLIETLFERLARLCLNHAPAIVVASVIAAAAALYYTAGHLGVNTDTGKLFSDELEWRKTKLDYSAAFPILSDNLILVIDAPTPELADSSAARLAGALATRTDLLEWVYTPGAGAFFDTNGLLYLDMDELEQLADNLIQMQPFIGRIATEPSLEALFDITSRAIEGSEQIDDQRLAPVLTRLAASIDATLENRVHSLSWREIFLDRAADTNDLRRFVLIKPKLDFDQLLPTSAVMELVRAESARLGLTAEQGISVRITGELAMAHEELDSVSRGALQAGLLALVLVSFVLGVGLRSLWLVLASIITLLVGLSLTAAFAAVSIGHLNLISVAFAVLYIGLGIDFAVHLVLRYRELVLAGNDNVSAVVQSTRDVGGTLFVCALTTGVGFFAFVWTDFTGVSELGLISGTGMFISLVAAVVLLPALLISKPAKLQRPSNHKQPSNTDSGPFPHRYRRAVLLVTAVLALVSVATLPQASFDRNSISVREAGTESVSTFLELLADAKTSPWPIALLTEPGAIADIEARVTDVALVDDVVSIEDFVPDAQDDKLWLIEELGLLLSLELEPAGAVVSSDPAALSATLEELLRQIDTRLHSSSSAPSDALGQLREPVVRLTQALAEHPAESEAMLHTLEQSLLSGLLHEIGRLGTSLEAEAFAVEDLPVEILERWIAADGRYRVEIYPTENVRYADTLHKYVDTVLPLVPNGTDSPVVMVRSGDVVVSAFKQAVLTAIVLISFVLIVILRDLRDTLLVLAPLLLASCFTVATMVALGIDFNFANVITLPLLLGIGVDNGIHMVRRARSAEASLTNIMRTSTARAVVVSALTTIVSFGNLAFSDHPGTASMGQVLTVGLVFNLVCTLVVLPALLGTTRPRSAT